MHNRLTIKYYFPPINIITDTALIGLEKCSSTWYLCNIEHKKTRAIAEES